MPMYGVPAGLLAAAGAGGGQGYGFGQSLGGVLNAFQGAQANQQASSDREIRNILQIGQLEQKIAEAQRAKEEQKRAVGQKLAQQGQAEELRQQIPEQFRELFDVDQKTAIARSFPEAQDPTTLQQNLAAAGLQPGTPQYQQTVLDSVTKRRQGETGAVKLPTGYRFADPANPEAGVVALKGGPADTTRPTTEQRNKLATAQKTHKQLTQQIQQYVETIRGGVATLPGPARDKVKTQREQIKLQLKNLYELGAITGPDEQILDNLIFDPTALSSQALGRVPGLSSAEDRALANSEILIEEANRALEAAQGNNPKAVEHIIQESVKKLGVSMSDVEFTAQQEGMTVKQVVQELMKRQQGAN